MSVGADPLHVLLSFALSHGNVNTILDTLQILLGACGPKSCDYHVTSLMSHMAGYLHHR